MTDTIIRKLEFQDIPTVSEMQINAWHEYYSQYPDLYSTIKHSETYESVVKEWTAFLKDNDYESKMVTGQNRVAFVALQNKKPIGIAAANSFTSGIDSWKPVEEYFLKNDCALNKIAKFQNLYVDTNSRGNGTGYLLNIARAKYMLKKGFTGIFLAPFTDASKTIRYHKKNQFLKHINDYMSLTTYENGKNVKISCFAYKSLQEISDYWEETLDQKVKRKTS